MEDGFLKQRPTLQQILLGLNFTALNKQWLQRTPQMKSSDTKLS